MTQSESLRIKRTVTLFLLEVGYNRKTAKFHTITCLKKGFPIILIRVNKKIHASQHVSKMTFEQMLTIHLQKTGEQVSVDPDGILSTRTYGLPRNLVFVITNSDRSTRALPLVLHSVNRINCIIPAPELQ